MSYRDRNRLQQELLDLVTEGCGADQAARLRATLAPRLHRLLDAFLLESQPPRSTEATILLADLRGFTAITESYPPTLVVNLLNRYFAAMASVVAAHGGMVDKFMGDSVMALFGAPETAPDDLSRALSCAVRMQQVMAQLNHASELRGEPRLYAGIGLNTGQVTAGSFGSALYNEYTVIGDEVNLAARIEAYSLRGQILVSESVYRQASGLIETGQHNRVQVKGKQAPVTLYELTAVTGPDRLEVPRVEVRRSPRIQVDLPLVFREVRNKRILPRPHNGRVLDLGYHGMQVRLPLALEPLSELVMTLTPDLAGGTSSELYARVIRCQPRQDAYLGSLAFTTEDTPGNRAVKQYVDLSLWGR
jgi:adenylate cyclase